jgi:uncharacterized protein involved in exopolysaccharide biosynthesis
MQINTSRPSYAIRFFSVFFSHWRLALAVFTLVFGAAAALALLAPDKYQSKMKVLIKNERIGQVFGMDQHTTGLINLDNISEARINSEIELLQSTDLLRNVAVRTGLAGSQDGHSARKAINNLQKSLSVRSLKRSNVIEVSYEGTSRAQSLQVLQMLSGLYLDSHVRLNGSPGLFDVLDKQVSDYQDKLSQAEGDLAKFREDNRIV